MKLQRLLVAPPTSYIVGNIVEYRATHLYLIEFELFLFFRVEDDHNIEIFNQLRKQQENRRNFFFSWLSNSSIQLRRKSAFYSEKLYTDLERD